MLKKKKTIFKIGEKFTSIDKKSISGYFNDLNSIPRISREEESELLILSREGNVEAQDKLVLANLRFVVSVAKKYESKYVSLEDLINEGNIGLIKAAQRFNSSEDIKFITYAIWWIRKSMLDFITENSRVIRLPNNKPNLISKVNKIKSKLEQTLGRAVEDNEVIEELSKTQKLQPSDIDFIMNLSNTFVNSLDSPIESESFDSEGVSLLDFISNDFSSDDYVIGKEKSKIINEMMSELNPTELTIIECSFGFNGYSVMGVNEIASRLNTASHNVVRVKKGALLKLKHKLAKIVDLDIL
jgi:RNA polymerase primary sigma factor